MGSRLSHGGGELEWLLVAGRFYRSLAADRPTRQWPDLAHGHSDLGMVVHVEEVGRA